MRGLGRKEFAKTLKEACCSIWIDDIAGFGTFPVESMKCGTPVLGKVPNMIPEWLTEDNGIWTYEGHRLPEFAATYIESWLEDAIPTELLDAMKPIDEQYKKDTQDEKLLEVFKSYVSKRKEDLEQHIASLNNEVE